MPRSIPINLQKHKDSDATTLCKILLFKAADGKKLGFTTLDRDVIYNDGNGAVTYIAPIGFQPASIYEALGFEVGNTEQQSLLVPEYDSKISEYDVNAGVWDNATFVMYEINYERPEDGHWIVQSGNVGEVRSEDGMQMFGELRGLTARMRNVVVEVDSRTCRARFGSQTGDPGVRFPCGFDAESLWVEGEVTSVGVEQNYAFIDVDALTESTENDYFVPGLITWLTGNNSGKSMEIDSYNGITGEFVLRHPLAYEIVTGDTYKRRRDCIKFFDDDKKGCKFWFPTDRALHFRGEPYIPVADGGQALTPGASTGPGSGGSSIIDRFFPDGLPEP